jgi:hypothetical protein
VSPGELVTSLIEQQLYGIGESRRTTARLSIGSRLVDDVTPGRADRCLTGESVGIAPQMKPAALAPDAGGSAGRGRFGAGQGQGGVCQFRLGLTLNSITGLSSGGVPSSPWSSSSSPSSSSPSSSSSASIAA